VIRAIRRGSVGVYWLRNRKEECNLECQIRDASQRVMDRRSFSARSSGSGGFFSTGRLMDTWIFFLFVAIAGKSCTLLAISFHTRRFSPFFFLPIKRESLRSKSSFFLPPPSPPLPSPSPLSLSLSLSVFILLLFSFISLYYFYFIFHFIIFYLYFMLLSFCHVIFFYNTLFRHSLRYYCDTTAFILQFYVLIL